MMYKKMKVEAEKQLEENRQESLETVNKAIDSLEEIKEGLMSGKLNYCDLEIEISAGFRSLKGEKEVTEQLEQDAPEALEFLRFMEFIKNLRGDDND